MPKGYWIGRVDVDDIDGYMKYVAANAKPFAEYGVAGNTTLNPGMCAVNAVQSCECCAPYLFPTETRNTTGILQYPPDIACHFAS